MAGSGKTTAQEVLKISDKVWKFIIPAIAYVMYLGTQQHIQSDRQDDFDTNMAKMLEVQYTYAIDINTLKITMAGYDSLNDMSDRLESVIEKLEDGT